MFSLTILALALSASAHSISHLHRRHHAIARAEPPAGWATNYLEPYDTYHTRYLAVGCENKHNTTFFGFCCHPLLATETLEKNRPACCAPGATAQCPGTSSVTTPASVATPTSVTTPAFVATPTSVTSAAPAASSAPANEDDDDGEDCEDEGDDGDSNDDDTTGDDGDDCEDEDEGDDASSSMHVAATSTPVAATSTPVAATSTHVAATSSAAPAKTPTSAKFITSVKSTSAKATVAKTSAAPPKETTEAHTTAKPTTTSTTAKSSPTTTSSSSSSDSDFITGGFGTWFTQNGVAGACGIVHQDTDLVVALPTTAYSNGANCGRKVEIVDIRTGATQTATVADECPTCDNDECLDMSKSLFEGFEDLGVGEFSIKYKFLD